MESREEVKTLPNPNVHREPCIDHCEGCRKTFPIRLSEKSVCICYQNPKDKWRNYSLEEETIKGKGEDKHYEYHLNPCPMATHVKHSPKVIGQKGFILNPIKQSKRG